MRAAPSWAFCSSRSPRTSSTAGAVGGRSSRRSLRWRCPSARFLLAFTPSKWIWHFGTLLGVVAVAAAVETERLAARRVGRRHLLVATAAIGGVALWATLYAGSWGPLDVGRFTWYHDRLPYVLATLVAIAVVVALGAAGRVRRWDVLLIPAATAAVVVVTVGAFAADAAVTSGWTAAGQTIGRVGACGVADDYSIPDAASILPLLSVAPDSNAASVSGAPFGLPTGSEARGWYRLPGANRGFGVFLERKAAPETELVVHWGRADGNAVRPLATTTVTPPEQPATQRHRTWVFVTEALRSTRPPRANVVRPETRRRAGGAAAAATTAPVSFASASLGALLADSRSAPLVDPFLFAAMPCAPLPHMVRGVVSAPHLLVEAPGGPNLLVKTSPFRGIDDLFVTSVVPVQRAHSSTTEIFVGWTLPDRRYALWPAATGPELEPPDERPG